MSTRVKAAGLAGALLIAATSVTGVFASSHREAPLISGDPNADNTRVPNRAPNNVIGDGVDANDTPFLATFPYAGTPQTGYDHVHMHGMNPMP